MAQDFDIARTEIKQHLQASISNIHISCDMWSSPNGHAFLGIVAHWMDIHHILHRGLIALPRIMGAHTGENIAIVLVDVLEKYNICEKLGYMMLDNATNNDTAVESLDSELIWRGIIPVISSEERRLRCFGHILNLVVKELLFGKDETVLETSKDEITAWRKLGPLGKLHNIVRTIRSSPQRRDRFHAIQITDQTLKDPTFMLRQDNDKRWNSTYDMIQLALQLQEAIDRYIVAAMAESRKSKSKAAERLKADLLHAPDWDELKVLYNLLSPFKELTIELQGNIVGARMNGAIFDVLPAMDMLLNTLEDAKLAYKAQKSHFASCINLAWTKLDEYYNLSDNSPIYVVAVMLDPRLKLQYIESRWSTHPEWIEIAQEKVRTMFNHYRNKCRSSVPLASISKSVSISSALMHSESTFRNWKYGPIAPVPHPEELDKYSRALLEAEDVAPIDYWKANKAKYPILASMAWDILSIPAMSSEVERVFSGYILKMESLTLVRNS